MASAQPVRRRKAKRRSIRQVARRCLSAGLFVPFAACIGAFIVCCIVTRTIAVSAWQLMTLILGPAPAALESAASDVTVHLPAGVITRITPTV